MRTHQRPEVAITVAVKLLLLVTVAVSALAPLGHGRRARGANWTVAAEAGYDPAGMKRSRIIMP
jgi:hypothetical protein